MDAGWWLEHVTEGSSLQTVNTPFKLFYVTKVFVEVRFSFLERRA